MQQTTRGWRERLAVVLGCLSARCGEAEGRAAPWNLVPEESLSPRMRARDGWRGPVMDARRRQNPHSQQKRAGAA